MLTTRKAPIQPSSRSRPAVRLGIVVGILALLFALAPTVAAAQEQTQAPADAATLLQNGDFALGRGNCALAQYYYQEAAKAAENGDPAESATALIGKGKALTCQGAYATAVEAFQQALEVQPNSVSARVQLALTYEAQFRSDRERFAEQLTAALQQIAEAERFAPDDPKVLNTKGILLFQSGDLAAAQAALERAATQAVGSSVLSDQERSTIQDNLGAVYRDQGQLDLAREAFRRAVVLDPSSASAHNNLGNVLFRQGNCDEAEYELSQAVSLAPSSLSPLSQLAITLFECDKVDASVPRFERAVAMDDAILFPGIYTYLARAYLQQGRLDDAVKRAQQGALLAAQSADAYYWLGRAYLARGAQGDTDAAKRALERALEIDPDYAAARDALSGM